MIDCLVRGFRRVFRKGLWSTANLALYSARERFWEWYLGIETASYNEWDRSQPDADRVAYAPLSFECLWKMFRSIKIDPNEDVFLDYGCGKGRVLSIAATRPFRRVIGVEVLPELADIARDNIQRARRKFRCQDVDVIVADATTYEVPTDVTVIYLFNPFTGDVLSAVQRQIHSSLLQEPRKLTLFYMNPLTDRDTFAGLPWLEKRGDVPTGVWDGVRFVAYESCVASPVLHQPPVAAT